ncbi:MAG: RAMP superfamily CRISPR-associated protein [Pseudomonadota bacterium]
MKTLEIHFLSDWHIGEGTGQVGYLDKLIRRHPQDGLPYLPAKTITGIWRDACQQVAIGLDDGKAGIWQDWVITLFGLQTKPADVPKTACLTVRAARFPKSLRQKLTNYPSLKEALTFIKPTVRIDRQTGYAVDHQLLFTEVVRAGAVLETQISIERALSQTQKKAAYALLWAGAKTVERLGSKRRRGTGRCEFKFHAINKNEALNILSQAEVPTCPNPPSFTPQFTQYKKASQTEAWVQVPLHLTLKTPVIVPNGEVGNVVYSLDYIPGTLLLGVVTQILQRNTKLELFPYLINGDIQVNHAYQEVLDTRGQPVPLTTALHRQGYISTLGLPGILTTPLQLASHGTIDDSIFSFQAIKAGTRLRSIFKLRQSVADQLKAVKKNWWTLLNTNIRVGKSKKDDYGSVQLQAESCQPMPKLPMQHHNNKLVVWLCSDLLLRDARLRPSADITDLQKELEIQLNVTLSRSQANARTSRKDGWHQKWGQPRPSYIGLAAGTCVVFKCGTLAPEKLQTLMYRGLGERRAEGFGEVRFNPPQLSTLPTSEAFSLIEPNEELSIPKDYEDFVRVLETAVWRTDIQRIAMTLSTNTKNRRAAFGWQSNKPPNNQLGGLRAVISRMQSPHQVLGWLAHLSKTSNRREKWSVHGLKVIKTLLESPHFVWELLHEAGQQGDLKNLFPTIRANAKSSLEEELWAEAVRTLFLMAMHYERKEREM